MRSAIPSDITVGSVWAKQLLECLRDRGLAVEPLLLEAGLNLPDLDKEGGRIPYSAHAAFLEIAAKVSGDSCFGFHFGITRDTRDVGLLGYVGIASKTLGDAIGNLGRYLHIFNDAAELEIGDDGEVRQLRFCFADPTVKHERQSYEFSATNVLRAYRQITGRNIRPMQMTFAHTRTDNIREFEKYFGCPVHFGRNYTSMDFRLTDLAIPIPTADSRLLAVLRGYGDENSG